MSPRLTRRRTAIAVASVAAVFGTALFTGTANAAPRCGAGLDRRAIVTPDGVVSSYILNARHQNAGNTRLLEKAVVEAGGVVVQSWPQIGVVVAHSTDVDLPGRRRRGRRQPARVGRRLAHRRPSRRAPPTDLSTDSVKGYKPGAKVKANGDIASAPTPFTGTLDPREGEQWDMQMIKADQAHKITDGNRNVLVGVLDSGIDPDHPDLAANIDVADSVNCTDAGRPDLSATGWYPTTE